MNKKLYCMLILLLALSAIFLSQVMTFSADLIGADQSKLSKSIQAKAKILANYSNAHSVQYALIDHGQITISGHYSKRKEKITPESLYEIGSVSKVFAAASVMKLVDEGKIDLDKPVYKYLQDFKMKDPRYRLITPRMLLNHSSGLRGTESGNDALFEDPDTYVHDTLLKTLSEQTLKANPGEFSVYCNSGFSLTEILVERISGMSFTQYIHKNFTDPLKMTHTLTPQDDIKNRNFAGFYMDDHSDRMINDYCNAIASGGIISTAEDMVRFSQIFMNQGDQLLSPKSVKAMENAEYKRGLWPPEADDSSNYGLGWDSMKLYPFTDYNVKALAKGGDLTTYSAALVVLPEKQMAAVVLTSGGNSGPNQVMASKMLLLALQAKGEIKTIVENKSFGKPIRAKIPETLMGYAGYYASSDTQIKIGISESGELTLSDDPKTKFLYTSKGTFSNPEGTCQMSFVKEKNGRTYLWKRMYETIPDLGQLALSEYVYEKLNSNTMSKLTAKAWQNREGMKYYALSNKFSADTYAFDEPSVKVTLDGDMAGYWKDRKIIDPFTAVSQIKIPGLAGRDTAECKFYTVAGVEYLKTSEALSISEKGISQIPIAPSFDVTLSSNGLARWYTLPAKSSGKTMTVSMPEKASFAVYDADGSCVHFSLTKKSNTVVLPLHGTVVFAGQPHAIFKVRIE